MPSAARAAAYSDSQAQVVKLAHRDLAAFWATLDKTNPVAAKEAMAEFVVALIESYGPISATVAADYYDELRTAAVPRGRFTARPGTHSNPEQVTASSNWAAQPLFADVPDDALALSRLLGSTQRLVQDWGRQTLSDNADRDPAKPRFARVPHGKTCEFCELLASRGAVYVTRESAGEFNEFHDECDCQITVSFSEDDLPYDPEPYLNKYLDARDATGSSDMKTILAAMRSQDGDATGSSSVGPKAKAVKKNVDAGRTLEGLRSTLADLERSETKFSSAGTRARIADLRSKIAARTT